MSSFTRPSRGATEAVRTSRYASGIPAATASASRATNATCVVEVVADGGEAAVAGHHPHAHLAGAVDVGRVEGQAIGVGCRDLQRRRASGIHPHVVDGLRVSPSRSRSSSAGVENSFARPPSVAEADAADDRVRAALPVLGRELSGVGPVVHPADAVPLAQALGFGEPRVVPGDGRVVVRAAIEPLVPGAVGGEALAVPLADPVGGARGHPLGRAVGSGHEHPPDVIGVAVDGHREQVGALEHAEARVTKSEVYVHSRRFGEV